MQSPYCIPGYQRRPVHGSNCVLWTPGGEWHKDLIHCLDASVAMLNGIVIEIEVNRVNLDAELKSLYAQDQPPSAPLALMSRDRDPACACMQSKRRSVLLTA